MRTKLADTAAESDDAGAEGGDMDGPAGDTEGAAAGAGSSRGKPSSMVCLKG